MRERLHLEERKQDVKLENVILRQTSDLVKAIGSLKKSTLFGVKVPQKEQSHARALQFRRLHPQHEPPQVVMHTILIGHALDVRATHRAGHASGLKTLRHNRRDAPLLDAVDVEVVVAVGGEAVGVVVFEADGAGEHSDVFGC